jgi:hypothetical protein
MAIVKALTTVITDKCAVTMCAADGSPAAVGYTKGDTTVTVEPVFTEIEGGRHQIGCNLSCKFFLIQFQHVTLTTIEALLPALVDAVFTGSQKIITITDVHLKLGLEAKMNQKDVLGFPCELHAFVANIDTQLIISEP